MLSSNLRQRVPNGDGSGGCAFWSLNEWSKGLETVTGSVIGADRSFAIRRCLHGSASNGLIYDIFVPLGILLAAYRVVWAPQLRALETHTGFWRVPQGERAITWDAPEPSVHEQRANR
jgi:hypothetical protein